MREASLKMVASFETVEEEYNGKPLHKLRVSPLGVEEERALDQKSSFSLASLRLFFVSVFLPAGYPHTVTEDYAAYQVWDTIQALASSMTGALATEAVLKGIGVGNESATALAASLTWLVKDGLGMLGRIAFSWAKGSSLDCDVKRWRLTADILNDLAFCLDLTSPHLPSQFVVTVSLSSLRFFFPCVCASSLFRCVVGVAGGATRTTVVQHQARRNNLADVAAKDGSQETLVNVIALVASLVLLPLVTGKHVLIWSLFSFFTAVHLYANYRAVRSLHLDIINRRTLAILVREFLYSRRVLSVKAANEREPIFSDVAGPRRLGCSLKELLQARCSTSTEIRHGDYWGLLDGRRGWLAVTPHADRLAAAFHLEWTLAGGDFGAVESSFARFKSELSRAGWKSDREHLCFDEWTFRFT